MKYNIFEFSQEAVLSLSKSITDNNGKTKIIKLDITDLAILNVISDFMNRPKIVKYTIDDKTYFSVQYKVILDDIPILDIKAQALSDRLVKMEMLGVIEKKVVKNQTGSWTAFRLGDKYEVLKYKCKSSELHMQAYQTTSAEVVDYAPKNNNTNNNNTNNNNNITNNTRDASALNVSKPQKKTKKEPFNVRADLSYVEEPFCSIWAEWLDYKDEKNKQYQTQTGAKKMFSTLLNYSENDPVLANAIVQMAIEKSWDGFFGLSDKQKDFFRSKKSPYVFNVTSTNADNDADKEDDGVLIINGIRYE